MVLIVIRPDVVLVTQICPSTQARCGPAAFVSRTVYCTAPLEPRRRSRVAGVAVFSMVQLNCCSQWVCSVFSAVSGGGAWARAPSTKPAERKRRLLATTQKTVRAARKLPGVDRQMLMDVLSHITRMSPDVLPASLPAHDSPGWSSRGFSGRTFSLCKMQTMNQA
jgi:hypothetical protein